jgi:dTDP-4-dehydrorhamnose 3,5-epimerase
MIATQTALDGVLLLEPRVFSDHRGHFFESFNAQTFAAVTGVESVFVQDNHSKSTAGVIRGLHYQLAHPQGKLVRVVVGAVFDVVVDLRRQSPTFGQSTGVTLTAENRLELWVPEGFAHGFAVLSEEAHFLYKTTDYWHPGDEYCIRYDDPELAIDWPRGHPPVVSEKDLEGSWFRNAKVFE